VSNAVRPTSRTVLPASSADSSVVCGTPIASRIVRTARPIGACAAFHSPSSPRMLTMVKTGI
jgi:hypothetical protein